MEPENRLVARTLEAEWEQRLSELACAQAELAQQEQGRPEPLTSCVTTKARYAKSLSVAMDVKSHRS